MHGNLHSKGPITWWVSPRAEISALLTELKFQTGFWNKSSENQIVDYMEKDSARGAIQSGLKKECEHAYLLCFRTSVNFLTEISVFRRGWNWPCNRNNI